MMDPDEQLKALDIIENYLKLAAKPLHPFNFFVTKSAKITDSNDIINDRRLDGLSG